ncbi:phosphotransferase [Streptococcus sanguinis]|nr:phosphotransferase [Streptococcus sanguinis]
MTFSSYNLTKLARKLANIHNFSQRYLMTFERVSFYDDLISSLHFRAFSYNPQLERIIPGYQALWKIFQENTEILKSMKSERGNIFIHNDLHNENLLLCEKEVVILDFGDCRYSLLEEDIGTLFWGILQKVERSKYEEMLDRFFKYYSRPIDKTVCFRYALQRFLDIHLYYLNENLKEAGLIKYQKEKFNKEEEMIDFLISKITE